VHRNRAGAVAALALVPLLPLVTGCGVRLEASRLVFDVTHGNVILEATSTGPVPTGETVITVRNDVDEDLRVILLQNGPPLDQLPRRIVTAVDGLSEPSILALTPKLAKRKNELATGGVGYLVHATSFHVYLRKGSTYTIAVVEPSGAVLGRAVVAGSSQ
jgi:hypothetical protein